MDSEKATGCLVAGGVLAILMLAGGGIGGCMYYQPQYHVYQQRMAGAAKLAEAESSRQILIQEAHAKMESAKMLAQAEIERAKGVAEANRIIGQSLHDNESYLKYLWISNMDHQGATIIYVPTETGMPILEAGRRAEKSLEAE